MNKQEQKQFDKFLEDNEIHFVNPVKDEDKNLIKQFISQIKANQRKEIVEEIIKKSDIRKAKPADELETGYDMGYDDKTEEIIKNLTIGSTTDFIIEIIKQHFQTTLPTDAEDCAKEIEKIIYEKLLDGWNAGFRSGKIKQHNEIDEALRLYQQEYANTKIRERPNGWTVLQDIKKINEIK